MSGIAILISGCDFSSANLGIVTEQSAIPILVTSLSIVQSGSYSGQALQMSVAYQPSNTSQTDVTWFITSGSEFASISSSGLLTINPNANNSAVTVNVISNDNDSVFASANLVVTYEMAPTYQITQLLSNATSSNTSVSAQGGSVFSTILTPNSGYEIGDVRVTMDGVNVTQDCTIIKSSESVFETPTWSITTPSVNGDVEIVNESHKVYLFNASDLKYGNIASTAKTSGSKSFLHVNSIIPVTQGQVIRLYYPETSNSNMITIMDDAETQTWHGVLWHHKIVEVTSNDWSNFSTTGVNVSSYLASDFSNFPYRQQYTVDVQSDIADSIVPYTVAYNATGVYIHWGIMSRAIGASASDEPFTSQTVSYGNTLTSKTLNDYGNIFTNHGNPCFKITIDESTLTGGYVGG